MSKVSLEDFRKSIRDIEDFPKPGIVFKDLTTAFKDPLILKYLVDTLYDRYKDKGITKVVGIESRGFIVGTALAYRLGAGIIPIRKLGKLPAEKYAKSYPLEYGEDTIEIHKDALNKDDIVLVHDDLLATGGTASAAIELVKSCGVPLLYANFLVELSFLNGKDKLTGTDVYSLLSY